MRGPDYVQDKARSRYATVWRDALCDADPGPYSFPLVPPSVAEIEKSPSEVSAWLTAWRKWMAQNPAGSLRTITKSTKFGVQPIHTHVDIPDTETLAGLSSDTAAHWEKARARWQRLSTMRPGKETRPWLTRIVGLDEYDFTTLLAAVAWFRANPRSGYTMRSVPVPDMHTKWLARHRAMVLACLGTPTGTVESVDELDDEIDPVDVPIADLDALGLRPLPREVGVVVADPAMRALIGGLRQFSTPVNELARLPLCPETVLIIENKEPALLWRDTDGLVIIHSLGNHLDILERLEWIPKDSCWYWGDLDRHGFTLLSRARSKIPRLLSLLMGIDDVEAYRHMGVEEDKGRYDPPDPTLGLSEANALAGLQLPNGKYLRTEQERIPISDAHDAHERALGGRGHP